MVSYCFGRERKELKCIRLLGNSVGTAIIAGSLFRRSKNTSNVSVSSTNNFNPNNSNQNNNSGNKNNGGKKKDND